MKPMPTAFLPARASQRALIAATFALVVLAGRAMRADEPAPTRPLRDLNKSYFPFSPVANAKAWESRRAEIKRRVLVASGLWPMPEKTPLHAVIHGRIEQDDYTVDKVYFESLPGHFVTGNLYRPKQPGNKMPAILSPHGHWPDGRFLDDQKNVRKQLETGAEKFESGARSHLQARCVQLARMGCAVFIYDMIGYADSVQFTEHRHGPQPHGFLSAEAELNLQGYLALQTWNSVRALDFLLSLPGIDRDRVGCTGESGGGTQTLILTGIDDRVRAAFPCVMTSTAMQGGCTCENANLLRINQGNVDIAALAAPRPLGVTAADDWTKELETKGYPDLKALYTMLGVPDRVEAHFNIRFPHNFNEVSRSQMYAFFNRHFQMGLANTDERDFRLLNRRELSVWDEGHPKPAGGKVGPAHERAVCEWFSAQAARKIDPLLQPKSEGDRARAREVIGGALEVVIGRTLPKKGESAFTLGAKEDRADYVVLRGVNTGAGGSVDATFLYPKNWNHTAVLWLSLRGRESILTSGGELTAAARRLLDAGCSIACPELYLSGATKNPNVYAQRKVDTYEGYAGYHYGYNPSLMAERVGDALGMIALLRDNENYHPERICVAGMEGAGVIAAAATALARSNVDRLVVDTEGFRFAQLTSAWDTNFLPGAVKYGDVPALLSLCPPARLVVLGEKKIPGGAVPVAEAVLARAK